MVFLDTKYCLINSKPYICDSLDVQGVFIFIFFYFQCKQE